MGMFGKDWDDDYALPTGSGKGADRTLGDRALAKLGSVGGFRTVMVPLPDGRTMMVRTKGGRPEYTVNELPRATPPIPVFLYMTSGAYELGTYNVGDPTLTTDVITYKTTEVGTTETTTFLSLLDPPPPANGDASNLYAHAALSGAALNLAKIALYGTRPSEFSGLMRRLVQGRYGRRQTTLALGTAPSEGGTDTRVIFGTGYGNTTGVVCFGTNYFIVSLKTDTDINELVVTARPLSIPLSIGTDNVADILTGISTTSGSERDAWETLFLSYVNATPATEVTLGTFTVPAGEPIAYGWNFSLTTNEAHCVIALQGGYGYDRNLWSHLSLTFSYASSVLACAFSIVEQVDGWSLGARSPIWFPFGESTKWWNQQSSSPDPTTAQNMPVYAYHIGDALRIVRWSYSATNDPEGVGDWSQYRTTQEWANYTLGPGVAEMQISKEYGIKAKHGFWIGSNTAPTSAEIVREKDAELVVTYDPPYAPMPGPYSAGSRTSSYASLNFGIYSSVNIYSYPGDTPSVYDPRPGSHYSIARVLSCRGVNTGESRDGSRVHSAALVVPAHDCCAIYIGSQETKSYTYSRITTPYSAVGPGTVEEWVAVDDGHGGNALGPMWIPPVHRQFSLALNDWGGFSGGATASGSESTSQTSIKYLGPVDLTVGTVDSQIFHPGPTLTVLATQVQAISDSIYGDARYHVGALTASEVETTDTTYPDGIDLFIGAS